MKGDILVVDDDPGAILLMRRILAHVAPIRFATNGRDALRLARECAPDLMLLDAEMPGLSGFEVCEAMKADPSLAQVPVIFVTSHTMPEFEVSGFEHGASDFIAKPVSAALVVARVQFQLGAKRRSDALREVAMVDGLTGVANRRRFDDALQREWCRAQRDAAPLSLLMVDVDHFKRFNDHYGHPAGDGCLRAIARALEGASLRPADLVARYGGEEFAILLPQTDRKGAANQARRLLAAIAALKLPHADSPTGAHVSVSVGISCYDKHSPSWPAGGSDLHFGRDLPSSSGIAANLVQAADCALYAAKRAGRDACLAA